MIDVLVPLKSLTSAKSRLAPFLSEAQREGLVVAMARDVLATLTAWPACHSIVVLQGKDWPPFLPASTKLRLVSEADFTGDELNGLLEQGVELLSAAQRLVLFADLPYLTVADLDGIAAALVSGSNVICPDRWEVGTNAIGFGNAAAPSFAFGPESLQRHRVRFAIEGVPPVPLQTQGLSRDIDSVDDVIDLLWGGSSEAVPGPATCQWLDSARRARLLAPGEKSKWGRQGARFL